MNFDDIDDLNQMAEAALTLWNWDVAPAASLLHLSQDAYFQVVGKFTGSRLATLRIHRPGFRTKEELVAEIARVNEISENRANFRVLAPLAGRNRTFLQEMTVDRQPVQVSLWEDFDGRRLSMEEAVKTPELFYRIGEMAGWLQKQEEDSGGQEQGGRRIRPVWDYDSILGSSATEDWRGFPGLTIGDLMLLQQTSEKIENKLRIFGKAPGDFGLIQGNLSPENLLIRGDEICIDSFNDCGYGWYQMDLAGTFRFYENAPWLDRAMGQWIKGYRNYREFKNRDYEMTDTFLMLQRMQLTAWLDGHRDSEQAQRFLPHWKEGTMALAEQYLRK